MRRSAAMLVAGGDIRIGTLTAGNAAHLTLVSATGRVEVLAIAGPLTLNAASRSGISLPVGPHVSVGPWPPLAHATVLGLHQ